MTVRVLLGQRRPTSVRLKVSPVADAIAGLRFAGNRWSAWRRLPAVESPAAGVLHGATSAPTYQRHRTAGSYCANPMHAGTEARATGSTRTLLTVTHPPSVQPGRSRRAGVRLRLSSILEDDLYHRMNRLSRHGIEGLFSDLHSLVSFDDGVLTVATRCEADPIRAEDELVLVPSVTCDRVVVLDTDASHPPLLIYPALGGACRDPSVWTQSLTLRTVVSQDRIALLGVLNRTMAVEELAERFRAPVSQARKHLEILESVGLVASSRQDREHYQRTWLGGLLVSPVCTDCI